MALFHFAFVVATLAVADIAKILDSVGATVDMDKLDSLVSKMEGRDIVDVVAEGQMKMGAIAGHGRIFCNCEA